MHYERAIVANYCALASSAFYIYDYSLTLSREVDMFWRVSSTTSAAVLYLSIRYFMLANSVYNILMLISMSDESCSVTVRLGFAWFMAQFVLPAVFSALRAYALSRNRALSLLIFILCLAPIVTDVPHFVFGLDGRNIPGVGCGTIYTVRQSSMFVFKILTIFSRGSLIIADVLLILTTWICLSSRGLLHDSVGSVRLNFPRVLLLDGTVYFVVLLTVSTLHLALSMASVQGPYASSYVNLFSQSISCSLVSRFLLDLQEAHRRVSDDNSQDGTRLNKIQESTVVFERMLAPLASSIVPNIDSGLHSGHWSHSIRDGRSAEEFVDGAVGDPAGPSRWDAIVEVSATFDPDSHGATLA